MRCKPEEIWEVAWANASRFLRAVVNTKGEAQVLLEEVPKELPYDELLKPDEELIDGPYVKDLTLSLPESFIKMNQALEAAGFYEMSPWWERVISRIYMFPRGRIVIRVGRRGGKSSMLSRYCAHEILYAGFEAPKGDQLIYPIVCQDKQRSRDRLKDITQVLEALGFSDKFGATKTTDGEIRFPDMRKVIRCTTCTPAAVVGVTCMGGIGDEVTRWRDSEGREMAAEVLRAWSPGLLTMIPFGARLALISSPVGENDAHAKLFSLGTTDGQLVFYAPTWVAASNNPNASKQATRDAEPDEQTWLREYGAVPMTVGLHQFFPNELLDSAMKERKE